MGAAPNVSKWVLVQEEGVVLTPFARALVFYNMEEKQLQGHFGYKHQNKSLWDLKHTFSRASKGKHKVQYSKTVPGLDDSICLV